MQGLGFDMKDMLAELVHNITISCNSTKDLPDWIVEFKNIVQPVLETNILCVMESVEKFLIDHDLGWFLAVP